MKNSSEVHGLCLGEGGPYPDNRGNFPGTWKIERKEKPLKILCPRRNITECGQSPISSLAILIRQAPFWPADTCMHTVNVQE